MLSEKSKVINKYITDDDLIAIFEGLKNNENINELDPKKISNYRNSLRKESKPEFDLFT
jgi:hypothetical protein